MINKNNLSKVYIPSKTTAEMLELHSNERKKYLSDRLDTISTSDYISRPEVCVYLGVSDNTLINWQKTDRLQVLDMNGKIKYNRADIIDIADKIYQNGKVKRLIED